MPSSYRGIRIAPHLEVVALSPRGWRVCDGRIHAKDATRLLGYVEEIEDEFEVLWMKHPGRSNRFRSLAGALAALTHDEAVERPMDARQVTRS